MLTGLPPRCIAHRARSALPHRQPLTDAQSPEAYIVVLFQMKTPCVCRVLGIGTCGAGVAPRITPAGVARQLPIFPHSAARSHGVAAGAAALCSLPSAAPLRCIRHWRRSAPLSLQPRRFAPWLATWLEKSGSCRASQKETPYKVGCFFFVMPCSSRSFRAMSPAMAQSALAEDSAELSAASGGYSEAELQKAGSTRQLLPQQRRATLPHCAER